VSTLARRTSWLAICVSLLALQLGCERANRSSNVNERNLRLVCETISTQKGWVVTGMTETRLTQLKEDAVWDVEGTVRMLDAVQQLPAEKREEVLQSGVKELENITLDAIAARIRSVAKRLGTGGPCTTAPASPHDAKRAADRLRGLQIPTGISSALATRIETLRQRANRVADGAFHRASCEGPAPLLFGWLDGKPVPLFDLLDAED
jgi:hypothetical protein